MVQVKDVVENGAYVILLEYGNIEGMITPNEYTTVRMKSVNKVMKVGKQEVVVVLRVDKEKGYIDLSKKRVQVDEIKACEDRFNKAKQVHSILRNVAEKANVDLERLYETIGWPLYKQFGHAFDALKVALLEPDKMFANIKMSEDIKEKVIAEIKRRLTPPSVKVRADFEMTCYTYEGIDGIREALRAGEKLSNPQVDIKFQVVTAPQYVGISNTYEKSSGVELMTAALKIVEQTIKAKGGNFLLKQAARVVGDKGDKDIKDMIKALDEKQTSDDEEENNDEAMDVDVEGDDTTNPGVKESDSEEEKE